VQQEFGGKVRVVVFLPIAALFQTTIRSEVAGGQDNEVPRRYEVLTLERIAVLDAEEVAELSPLPTDLRHRLTDLGQ
jgi:hypothetical protein